MEELKLENARLQKVVDILESQPELLFCVTIDGKITYMAERTLNFVKSALPNAFTDKDPSHINQILSDESVSIVLRTVAQLEAEIEHESMSSVKVSNLLDVGRICIRLYSRFHNIGGLLSRYGEISCYWISSLFTRHSILGGGRRICCIS